jgi:penicillin amidase
MLDRCRWLVAGLLLAVAVADSPPGTRASQSAGARLAQTSGTLHVTGLRDPVEVVRDRWGIPHIYARSQDDLFFAQGFVQAQDRLFQMDLWRRTTQGRLAEILGPDYVERDRLARLLRYRGDMALEWSSYSPDTKEIAGRFVAGVNAWVDMARKDLPLEFQLAGYEPETWDPEDLLSRSEAFTMSGNASAEVSRARLTAALGVEDATRLLPPDPPIRVSMPDGLDLAWIGEELQGALRTIGRPARFGTSPGSAPEAADEGSNNWVISGARSATGTPLLANDPHRALDHPSLRYIVHLKAPGWNVIGAVVPWFPGVAIGHNERIAWGLTIFSIDAQDLYVERLKKDDATQYAVGSGWAPLQTSRDEIAVRGQAAPVVVEHTYTRHGPVVYADPKKRFLVALRWTGSEPGTAGYLAGLALSRATNWTGFRAALARWKMPGENFVYADVDGNIGYQAAGLAPIRRRPHGLYPTPGWSRDEWNGWYTLDDLPHEYNPPRGYVATANHNTLPDGFRPIINYSWASPARILRIREVLESRKKFSLAESQELQHDTVAWNAQRLVPLLEALKAARDDVERARSLLVGWDRRMTADSAAALVYAFWERELQSRLAAIVVGRRDAPAVRPSTALLGAIVDADRGWFGSSARAARDRLILGALEAAVDEATAALGPDPSVWQWGRLHTATFVHPLATDDRTRALLNVGPFARPGNGETVFATGGSFPAQTSGASFRQILDVGDWDRSVVSSAPGQSGQPGSPHFANFAALWAEHRYVPLAFSDAAVGREGTSTLVLTPRGDSRAPGVTGSKR